MSSLRKAAFQVIDDQQDDNPKDDPIVEITVINAGGDLLFRGSRGHDCRFVVHQAALGGNHPQILPVRDVDARGRDYHRRSVRRV